MQRKGLTVIKNVLSKKEWLDYCQRLEKVYNRQVEEFGEDKLEDIAEKDMARMPFLYDDKFIELLKINIVKRLLGEITSFNYKTEL